MTAANRPDEPHDEAAHDAEFQRTLERLVKTPPKPHKKEEREPKPAPKEGR